MILEFDRAGGIATTLEAAPFGLGRLVGDALHTLVIDNAERAVRWLSDGGADMAAISSDDLRDVIGPLADRLRSR